MVDFCQQKSMKPLKLIININTTMVQDNMDFLDMECPYCEENPNSNYGSDYDIDTERLQVVWEDRHGNRTPIPSMTTSHIKRCIQRIKRSVAEDRPWRVEYLKPLLKELRNREFYDAMRKMSDEEFNRMIHKETK